MVIPNLKAFLLPTTGSAVYADGQLPTGQSIIQSSTALQESGRLVPVIPAHAPLALHEEFDPVIPPIPAQAPSALQG
jgi:hypothetical protein